MFVRIKGEGSVTFETTGVHSVRNGLQVVMGLVELGEKERAIIMVRTISASLSVPKEDSMLLKLVELLRRWESHVQACEKCVTFELKPEGCPCMVGRVILFEILSDLRKGL